MATMKKESELNDLIDQRQEIIGEMCDLKNKQQVVEHKVKTQIIRSGQTDLLSVNWTRVVRGRYR